MNTDTFIRRHVRKLLMENGYSRAPLASSDPTLRPGRPVNEESEFFKKSRQRASGKKPSRRSRGQFRVVSSVLGRIPKGMRPANPADVMKNLEATGRYTGMDAESAIEAIESLMEAAIGGADAMQRAYGGVSTRDDGQGRRGVVVGLGELDLNNAARYLKITLEAARDSGMLTLGQDVRVETSSLGIVIYESPGGAHSWGRQKSRRRKKSDKD